MLIKEIKKVPDNIFNDLKLAANDKSIEHNANLAGNIETVKYPVDKTWEQRMLIFPAKLSHCVYPFYGTDEYRITMSGNIRFRV
jgi:hypothetical protein